MQFSVGDDQYVLNVQKIGEAYLASKLKPFFEERKIAKVGSFWQHDYQFLRHLKIRADNLRDTYLNEHLLNKGKPDLWVKGRTSLQGLASRYLAVTLSKLEREAFINRQSYDFSTKEIEYAANDVKYLVPIYKIQKDRLIHEGMNLIEEIESACLPGLSSITYNGIYLDKKIWLDILDKSYDGLRKAYDELNQYFSNIGKFDLDLFGLPAINYKSNLELLKALKKVGYTNLESTNDIELGEHLDPILYDLIRRFRVFSKSISTYGESFLDNINPVTGRIHPRVNQLGADSGRITESDPTLQNIPIKDRPEFRTAFQAQYPKWLLNTTDYSGQELRIIAEMSDEDLWVDALNNDKPLHQVIGMKLFNLSEEKLNKKSAYYLITKTLNFLVAYGGGVRKVQIAYRKLGINKTLDECKAILRNYYKLNSKVVTMIDNEIVRTLENGYSTSLLGRKRFFNFPSYEISINRDTGRLRFSPKSGNQDDAKTLSGMCREAFNHRVQGTGADMSKIAVAGYDRELTRLKSSAFIVNTVHDELMDEFPETEKELSKIKTNKMLDAEAYILKKIKPAVESHISKIWEK